MKNNSFLQFLIIWFVLYCSIHLILLRWYILQYRISSSVLRLFHHQIFSKFKLMSVINVSITFFINSSVSCFCNLLFLMYSVLLNGFFSDRRSSMTIVYCLFSSCPSNLESVFFFNLIKPLLIHGCYKNFCPDALHFFGSFI